MIIYISDTNSVNRMDNFWETNMLSQNIKETNENWIGGEYYIQTSLYNLIKNNSNFKIITNQQCSMSDLEEAQAIIFPGTNNYNDPPFDRFSDKVYSYFYLPRCNKNILNPYRYNDNIKLLPITPIKLDDRLIDTNRYSNYNCNGLLFGKCISHVQNRGKLNDLSMLLSGLKRNIFGTMRSLQDFHEIPNYLNGCKNEIIETTSKMFENKHFLNLGILNPINFRNLLMHCKYVIFYHSAFAPPSIIEALYCKCILLITSDMISEDLKSNKNVVIIDNLSVDEINKIIDDIENNILIYDENAYPEEYTEDNKMKILLSL